MVAYYDTTTRISQVAKKKKSDTPAQPPPAHVASDRPDQGTIRQVKLNSKQKMVWNDIFFDPIKSSVKWDDIMNLFKALGGDISNGRGSRVRILLNGNVGLFHRPHPEPTTDKGALKSVRTFLLQSGVKHETGI